MPDVPKIVFSYYLNWLNERIGKNWRVINLTIFDLASGEVDDLLNERRINYGGCQIYILYQQSKWTKSLIGPKVKLDRKCQEYI